MREQREPWLKLPTKEPGSSKSPRLDTRFRTHVVAVQRPSPPASLQSPEPPRRSSAIPKEPKFELSLQRGAPQPSAAAIERAAAAAGIGTSAAIRLRPRSPPPRVAPEVPRPAPKPVEPRPAAAQAMGFDDVALVTSADWAVKVGEAAKLVDVVVVLYTAAYLGSEMFKFAFRTVVNEVLPQTRRPYTVYRFSLDDEPEFVPEMVASLGLPLDNPVTQAGFAWSGPGRRLFVIGDRALQSSSVFQRALRRNLTGEAADNPRAVTRRDPAASRDRPYRGALRPWSGRVLAIVAWCLFGSAAVGAAVMGVAPQWASSLLHPESQRSPASAPKDPSGSSNTQSRPSPSAASLGNTSLGEAVNGNESGTAATANTAKPARSRGHKKRAPSSFSAAPSYWGLPETDTR